MSFGYYSYDSPLRYDVMWDEAIFFFNTKKGACIINDFLLLKKLNYELKYMLNKIN
jgi:hypothetical protein